MPVIRAVRVGVALFALGLICFSCSIDRSSDGRALGVLLTVAGMIVYATCYVVDAVNKVNRPADDAWDDGYEVGFNKGWLERDGEMRSPLRLVAGDRWKAASDAVD